MIDTVDQLIAALEAHRGKPVMIEELLGKTVSHILLVEDDETGTCIIQKSVRNYPKA